MLFQKEKKNLRIKIHEKDARESYPDVRVSRVWACEYTSATLRNSDSFVIL